MRNTTVSNLQEMARLQEMRGEAIARVARSLQRIAEGRLRGVELGEMLNGYAALLFELAEVDEGSDEETAR